MSEVQKLVVAVIGGAVIGVSIYSIFSRKAEARAKITAVC
jgi:hypothetical protein